MLLPAQPLPKETSAPPGPVRKRRRRRGVTAMEYLVMASLVIVVVILAVQHIGNLAGGMFSNSAKQTEFANPGKKGP